MKRLTASPSSSQATSSSSSSSSSLHSLLYFSSFLFFFLFVSSFPVLVTGDAWNPIRYNTEAAFLRANSHERSSSEEEMNGKIQKIRERRGETHLWNASHPKVAPLLSEMIAGGKKRPPNLLFLFADDLGFGDLSVPPFKTPFDEKQFPCVEGGILTPQLERMAREGVRMTNFHSAAPVCSPSRTSAMTGLYSWRMTAMNAFELGRDPWQRNGFLPQIPTLPELLREAGYFTLHSGKWHLGGMREELRRDRAYNDLCSRPSPNQHGFEEYISELDGPESPRYTFLLSCACLHTKGHRHLIKDDAPVPVIEPEGVKEFILSDREAGDAIHYMRQWKETNPNQPWFMQVWFNAPHGPWEVIKGGEELYNKKYNTTSSHWEKTTCPNGGRPPNNRDPLYQQRWYYKTMVSSMDTSIGKILDAVKELGIEEETLIVFSSDNGHEMGAGDPGFFREGKRSLMEGGVRVPAIWKWKGTFPENSYTTYFGALTDILPTFLQAAHVPKPSHIPIDGISLLPVLTKATPIIDPQEVYNFHGRKHVPGEKEIQLRYFPKHHSLYENLYKSMKEEGDETAGGAGGGKGNSASIDPLMSYLFHEGYRHVDLQQLNSMTRVFLWHKDTDPYSRDERMQSGGHYDFVKVLSSSPRGCLDRIFDMKVDPTEQHNLFAGGGGGGGGTGRGNPHIMQAMQRICPIHFDMGEQAIDIPLIQGVLNRNIISHHHCHSSHHTAPKYKKLIEILSKKSIKTLTGATLSTCEEFYSYYYAMKVVIVFRRVLSFAKTGNLAHMRYMQNDVNKATCLRPLASQIKPFSFQDVCPANTPYSCSIPEF